jgi:hypothetical protein
MNVPTKSELVHLQIQATMREYIFEETQVKYLGFRDNDHWYLFDGEHEVPTSAINHFGMDE